jgi:hypothetical protein
VAIIDRVLPLTTFVVFMGGNSGQTLVELLQGHDSFARYDSLQLDPRGAWDRTVYMPFTDSQYVTKLPHAELLDPDVGSLCWLRDDATRQWLRDQTNHWFTTQWQAHAMLDIDTVIDRQLRLIIPTHLTPEFLSWIMPESIKLFVVDHNSYFSVRADREKNHRKHPTDPAELTQYIAQRVAMNRTWNSEIDFNIPNSMRLVRSELICDDRATHDRALRAVMDLHQLDLTSAQSDAAWKLICDYQETQRKLGYIT